MVFWLRLLDEEVLLGVGEGADRCEPNEGVDRNTADYTMSQERKKDENTQ